MIQSQPTTYLIKKPTTNLNTISGIHLDNFRK